MSSTLRPSINMPSYTWEMKCPVGAESCAQCPAHILRDVGVRYALQLRRFLRLQILEKFLQPADLGLQMSEAVFDNLRLGQGNVLRAPICPLLYDPLRSLLRPLKLGSQGVTELVRVHGVPKS